MNSNQSNKNKKVDSTDVNPQSGVNGLTFRALIISLILTVIGGFWVRQAEIVVFSTQVSESIPPIPALTALMLLIVLNPVIKLIGKKFILSRQEILTIYCFVAIAIAFMGCGSTTIWLSLISSPFYLASDSNKIGTIFKYIPSWLAVKDIGLIKGMYEGGMENSIPWRAWLVPLITWGCFFMGAWLTFLCMMMMFKNRWADSEKLIFPIVELPTELTAPVGERSQPGFFKNKLMWAGFAIGAIFNLTNILHALFPAVPSLGNWFYIPNTFSAPWSAAGGVATHFRPELVGFGFLVPIEICFSIWAFFFIGRLELVASNFLGNDVSGMPFEQEQSIGAYLVLGIWLIWQARKEIAEAARAVFNKNTKTSVPRWALPGFIAGFIFLSVFCMKAGMAGWAAVLYLGLVIIVALVTNRMRAEVGVPIIWLFPFYQHKKLLLNLFGTAPFTSSAAPATLTLLTLFAFLSRGYFPALSSYQTESLRIGDKAGISQRSMIKTIIFGLAAGIVVSFFIYISTYYKVGAAQLSSIDTWFNISSSEYPLLVASYTKPIPPDTTRSLATLIGAIVTAVLLWLRNSIIGFPLHPMGYAIATAYGSLLWWSFFLVWLIKLVIIRMGGMKMYRQAIPMFLGIALGHFFVAGVIWGLSGAIWPDGSVIYKVIFG